MPDSEMKDLFIKNLKRILKEQNCMASELAEGIGVRRSTISNWMSGLSLPRMEKVNQICGFFNIDRSELFKDDIERLRLVGGGELVQPITETRNELLGDLPRTRQEGERWKENILIENFHKLNTKGKQKAIEDVEDLTYIEKYTEPDKT